MAPTLDHGLPGNATPTIQTTRSRPRRDPRGGRVPVDLRDAFPGRRGVYCAYRPAGHPRLQPGRRSVLGLAADLPHGAAFVAVGVNLVFGRRWTTLDRGKGLIVRQSGLMFPTKSEQRPLSDFDGVRVRFEEGDSDTADRYPVALTGKAGRPDQPLTSPVDYAAAREQAGFAAGFLRLPLVDATTDHETVVTMGSGPPARPASGRPSPARARRPAAVHAQRGRAIPRARADRDPGPRVPAAVPARLRLAGLLCLVLRPGAARVLRPHPHPRLRADLLRGFHPALLRAAPRHRDDQRDHPFHTRAHRGRSSAEGIRIEEQGAWRRRATVLPAGEIFGIDYSSAENSLSAYARVRAARRRRTSPGRDRASLGPRRAAPVVAAAGQVQRGPGEVPTGDRRLRRWAAGRRGAVSACGGDRGARRSKQMINQIVAWKNSIKRLAFPGPFPCAICCGLVLLPLVLCAATAAAAPQEQTLSWGGTERHYLIGLPSGYNARKSCPLLLVFHGGGGNPGQVLKSSDIRERAEREGWILVAPAGSGRMGNLLTWNVGFGFGYALTAKVDDVGFVRRLLDELQATYRIDPDRIYATGISNGGILCHQLAGALSDRIAAIAPIVASAGGRLQGAADWIRPAPPRHPVAVVAFNGALDLSIPLSGGLQQRSWAEPVEVWSARGIGRLLGAGQRVSPRTRGRAQHRRSFRTLALRGRHRGQRGRAVRPAGPGSRLARRRERLPARGRARSARFRQRPDDRVFQAAPKEEIVRDGRFPGRLRIPTRSCSSRSRRASSSAQRS